jgi:hypothetical protein
VTRKSASDVGRHSADADGMDKSNEVARNRPKVKQSGSQMKSPRSREFSLLLARKIVADANKERRTKTVWSAPFSALSGIGHTVYHSVFYS